MTSPQPHPKRRALRVRLPGMPPATIRLEDGQRFSAKLQTASVTGGLLQVLKPLSTGRDVEVMFLTQPARAPAMRELFTPRSAARIALHPTRLLTPASMTSPRL